MLQIGTKVRVIDDSEDEGGPWLGQEGCIVRKCGPTSYIVGFASVPAEVQNQTEDVAGLHEAWWHETELQPI